MKANTVIIILTIMMVINYLVYKQITNNHHHVHRTRLIVINKPIADKKHDICHLNKIPSPSTGSYLQRTNNTVNKDKCDCLKRSFELCNSIDPMDQCEEDNCNYSKLNTINNSSSNMRVNKYRGDKSGFSRN